MDSTNNRNHTEHQTAAVLRSNDVLKVMLENTDTVRSVLTYTGLCWSPGSSVKADSGWTRGSVPHTELQNSTMKTASTLI